MRWIVFLELVSCLVTCSPAYAEYGEDEVEKIIYSSGQADGRWMDMGSSYSITGTIDVTGNGVFPAAIYGMGSSTNVHTINLYFNMDVETDLVLLLGIFSESGGDSMFSAEEMKVLLNGELLQSLDLLSEVYFAKDMKKQRSIMVPAKTGDNVLTLDMSYNLNRYNCWFDYVILYQPKNP